MHQVYQDSLVELLSNGDVVALVLGRSVSTFHTVHLVEMLTQVVDCQPL